LAFEKKIISLSLSLERTKMVITVSPEVKYVVFFIFYFLFFLPFGTRLPIPNLWLFLKGKEEEEEEKFVLRFFLLEIFTYPHNLTGFAIIILNYQNYQCRYPIF
jgi:hypothetical protein